MQRSAASISPVLVRRVEAPVDPLALARRLAHRPGLSVLASLDPSSPYGRFSYVACDPVAVESGLDPLRGARAQDAGSSAPWFIGTLPYEALRTRWERPTWSRPDTRAAATLVEIEWLQFDAVLAIDHEGGTVHAVGDDDAAVERLATLVERSDDVAPHPFELGFWDDEDPARHVERVGTAIDRIFEGEIYQVNLARKIGVRVSPAEPLAILGAAEALLRASPTPFGAVLRTSHGQWVISTSPELLLDARANASGDGFDRLATEPIKGTRRRAGDAVEDEALRRALDADPKEQAELAMIVDVERNDLARVCVPGSVVVEEPPHVVSFRTVHHRLALVAGSARPGLSRADVLSSIVPSGSVTGAPKVRAMETIAELEPMRRGLYTGGLGFLGRDGSMRLSMAIRTAVLDPSGEGEYLVGGGIVAASDPEAELVETRWKAAQLEAIGHSASRPGP